MSKTGGGRGTNQHKIRGKGVDGSGAGSAPPAKPLEQPPVTAVTHLELPDESAFDLSPFVQKPLERAVFRLMDRKTNIVFNDAKLEGAPFTEPEVATLLEESGWDESEDFEVNRVLALSEATDRMIGMVRAGRFAISRDVSDELHGIVGEFEALDAGTFRGGGAVNGGGGKVDVLGELFKGPDPQQLPEIFAEGVERVQAYEHPALRAVGYAAFATYNQFYYDANKRTARLMMNGALMSSGFDAIVTPAVRKTDYNRALHALFIDADPRPYMAFLLSCYDG